MILGNPRMNYERTTVERKLKQALIDAELCGIGVIVTYDELGRHRLTIDSDINDPLGEEEA